MALNNMGLGVIFTAKDGISSVNLNITNSFNKIRESISNTTKMLGGVDRAIERTARTTQSSLAGPLGAGFSRISAGLGASLKMAAQTAGDFEQAMAGVGAIADANTEQLEELRKTAIKMGIDTQFSPTQAAEAMRNLAAAGYKANQVIELIGPSLDLAAGSLGELDPDRAGNLIAQVAKGFGLQGDEVKKVADVLLKSGNISAVQAGELPRMFGQVTASAKTANQTLEETTALLSLTRNVVPGIKSATAVGQFLQQIQSKKIQDELSSSLGVDVIDKQTKQYKKGTDIIFEISEALKKKFGDNQAALGTYLTGTFNMQSARVVTAAMTQMEQGVENNNGQLLKGVDVLKYFTSELQNAGEHIDPITGKLVKGAAAQFRDKMLDTFKGQQTLLRGSLETLMIELGTPLTHAFRPAVEVTVNTINRLIKVVEDLPAPVKDMIAKVALGTTAVLGIAGALLTAKAALAGWTIAMRAAGMTGFGSLAGAAPMILGVAAAIGILKVAWDENLGGIQEKTERAIQTIKLVFEGLAQLFTSGEFSGAVLTEMDKIGNEGIQSFVIKVYMLGYRLVRFIQGIWEGFSAGVSKIVPALGQLWDAVSRLFGGIIEVLGVGVGDALGTSSNTFAMWGALVGDMIAGVITWMVQLVTWLVEIIPPAVKFVVSVFETIWPTIQVIIDFVVMLGKILIDFVGYLFTTGEGVSAWGTTLYNTFMAVYEIVAFVVQFAIDIIGALIQGIAVGISFIAPFFEYFINAFRRLWDGVLALLRPVIHLISLLWDFLGPIFGWLIKIAGFLASVLGGALAGALGVVADVLGVVLKIFGALIDMINWFIETIKSAWNWLTSFLGFDGDPPTATAIGKVTNAAEQAGQAVEDAQNGTRYSNPGAAFPQEPGFTSMYPEENVDMGLYGPLSDQAQGFTNDNEYLPYGPVAPALPALAFAQSAPQTDPGQIASSVLKTVGTQPIQLKATIELDGDKLGEKMLNYNRNNNALQFYQTDPDSGLGSE